MSNNICIGRCGSASTSGSFSCSRGTSGYPSHSGASDRTQHNVSSYSQSECVTGCQKYYTDKVRECSATTASLALLTCVHKTLDSLNACTGNCKKIKDDPSKKRDWKWMQRETHIKERIESSIQSLRSMGIDPEKAKRTRADGITPVTLEEFMRETEPLQLDE